jgi:hypothetical protein
MKINNFQRVTIMPINRNFFFSEMHESLFKHGLQQHQVDGIEAILNEWEANHGGNDDRWLAYMLATAYHETAFTMQPVRETLANTDDKAIAILDNAFAKGKLSWVKKPYWDKDPQGHSWLGRGLVQLTFKANYEKLSKPAGVDLVAHPEKAMEMGPAVKIMFAGMEQGLFTKHKLADYFNAQGIGDWVNARRIINGLDRAKPIAEYGRAFYRAISYTT